MNLIIEEIKSWTNLEIGIVILEILFGVASISIVAKLTSIQEELKKIAKELKDIKDKHISELKGENNK